jgi:hypothetical protein
MTVTLSRWYELMVHQNVDVKGFQELFDYHLYKKAKETTQERKPIGI